MKLKFLQNCKNFTKILILQNFVKFEENFIKILRNCENENFRSHSIQGWAPHSFPFSTFHSFPFFKRTVPFFSVLFRSFIKNGKERKERNVLLQRKEKNAKNATFFCKERKRTLERFILLQKKRERCVLFSIYI